MDDLLTIAVADRIDDDLAAAVRALLPQLSTTASFDRALLERMIASDATELFVARLGERIVGIATLVTFAIPTGIRGHVDDVVVDESARGHGVGRALLDAMIARAAEAGVRTLDLTSRPSRASAIRLYEAAGFARRDSLLLRYQPD